MTYLERPSRDDDQTRREFIGGSLRLAWATGIVGVTAAGPAFAKERSSETDRSASPGRADFMQRAFEMRRIAQQRGDQAYGAVIVKGGKIVGEGISSVLVRPDPTAHGEVEAIRDAARRLGTNDLSGCEIYSTAQPCPMCETACYWARISRVYYGSAITDGGPPRFPSC